jgi:16S rRNA (cytidine1402-2'-O)-methyltransferase
MPENLMKNTGTLYLVSTPIGNLKDITYRAVEVLKSVGLIAAEDTRHTQKLLNHYLIKCKKISYHDHNKEKSAAAIIRALKSGTDVALVSDAGTPGISDPGYYLVNQAYKNGIRVTACPGPCAALMALSISGLPTDRFSFFGFLPPKSAKRKKILKTLANENKSVVLYESSGRIKNLLKDIYEVIGDRYLVITRELTKVFEETIRGTLSELLKGDLLENVKGEFTVIISAKEDTKVSIDDLKDEITALIKSGESVKTVSKLISEKYDVSKKEVYSFCLKV